MNYEGYEISISIDGKTGLESPKNFGISLRDSIYWFFPKIHLDYIDNNSILLESGLLTSGILFKIIYGDLNKKIIKFPATITSHRVTNNLSNRALYTQPQIDGTHEFFNDLKIESKSWKKSISGIVEELIVGNFKEKIIKGTGCVTYWYNPYMNQVDFIEKILLPHSWSAGTKETPYYCFIDVDNKFHFEHYDYMINKPSIETLYLINTNALKEKKLNLLESFEKLSADSFTNKDLRNRYIFYFDKNSGGIIKENDNLKKHGDIDKILLLKDSNFGGYLNLENYEDEDIGFKEAKKGLLNSSLINTYFLERFGISTYLNLNLTAGNTIELYLPILNEKGELESSKFYKNKYLIEESEHTWNRKEGFTRLILSRKVAKLPDSYKIKSKLF